MTVDAATDADAAIVDMALDVMKNAGVLAARAARFNPALFRVAQQRIEPNFTVPQTTISPVMRRFLFQIGYAAGPGHIYAAGSYVGFAFAWLVAGRAAVDAAFTARGVDIDQEATAIAARNLQHLDGSANIGVSVADALQDLQAPGPAIDLLFIDVDCPDRRKAAYAELAAIAAPRLSAGALVLAHDPLVPAFAEDFRRYFDWLDQSPAFGPTCTLPLDTCGISVTVTR